MLQERQQRTADAAALKLGGIGLAIGSVVVLGCRMAHGDTPAADPQATLRFISDRPYYASIHLGTILGVLVWVGGIVALAGTLEHRFARLLGRWGGASVLVGAAIFSLGFAIDGVAGQDLATAWAAAPPAAQPDLVLATHIADTMLRGPSLVAIVILWGVPLLLFGPAVMLEGYPRWLGWTGLAVGALTVLGATALLLQPDLFPGVLVYGVVASILVQLWSFALGIAVWRRAGAASGATAGRRAGA
ncbi:MAG TPA: hypothetical protein VII06_39520 [Chloroflexota bacterium]|jgi:hypothetical protein